MALKPEIALQPHSARKAAGRQPSRKSRETRQRILDAAAGLCAQKGYSLTKLSDVANDAGIHLTGLYYYFDTKEALITAVLAHVTEQATDALDQALAALPDDMPVVEQLAIGIHSYLRHTLRQDAYGRAHLQIVQQAPSTVRANAIETAKMANATFQRLIERAAAAGELRTDIDLTMSRMILLGAMNWSVEWFGDGSRTVDDFANHVVLIVLGGLKA